jgi:hypothetical protein
MFTATDDSLDDDSMPILESDPVPEVNRDEMDEGEDLVISISTEEAELDRFVSSPNDVVDEAAVHSNSMSDILNEENLPAAAEKQSEDVSDLHGTFQEKVDSVDVETVEDWKHCEKDTVGDIFANAVGEVFYDANSKKMVVEEALLAKDIDSETDGTDEKLSMEYSDDMIGGATEPTRSDNPTEDMIGGATEPIRSDNPMDDTFEMEENKLDADIVTPLDSSIDDVIVPSHAENDYTSDRIDDKFDFEDKLHQIQKEGDQVVQRVALEATKAGYRIELEPNLTDFNHSPLEVLMHGVAV